MLLVALLQTQNCTLFVCSLYTDDAGASCLRLLLDTATYGSNSVLAPSMAAWQGPALLAFNDALFSSADFHNISRIGQDSKLERPTSIGESTQHLLVRL